MLANCPTCGAEVAEENLLRTPTITVCSHCKDAYVQTVQEGGDLDTTFAAAGDKRASLLPMEGLQRWVLRLLLVDIAFSVLATIGIVYELIFLQQSDHSDSIVYEVFTHDWILMGINLPHALLLLVLGILFLKWIYRTNKNLHQVARVPMRFTPGWTIGYYFIPIVNLFRPYQVMKELYQQVHLHGNPDSGILPLWWTLWIVTSGLNRASFRMSMRAETFEAYQASVTVSLPAEIVGTFLSLVAFLMVRRIGNAYRKNIGP